MSKLSKLEPVVKMVLEEYEETRSDDFKLIYSVYRELDFAHTTRELFYEIMMNHDLYKLPPFESITRCRRKIQKNGNPRRNSSRYPQRYSHMGKDV